MAAPILGPGQVETAAALLREGSLVAFPTDTVYGVASLADSSLHSARLQAFKGGRAEPFSLHLPDVKTALEVAGPLRELAVYAVTTLAPRGVTVIVAHGADQAGLGLRVVAHETGSAFLALAGAAVVATSANLHGQPPLNDPEAIARLPGIAAVLSVGVLPERPASTVVRMLRCGVEILRRGTLGPQELAALFSRQVEFVCLGNLNRSAFAAALLAAMQRYYSDSCPGFVPAYLPESSGIIANPGARAPQKMLAHAASYHVEMAGHVPRRYQPGRGGLRVAMGEDVWDALPGARRWSVYDPMGGPDDAFREMAVQVRAHLESLLCRSARVRASDVALEAGFDVLFSSEEKGP